ncbi:MAG TPA: phosphotransferase [Trebonia sp.]|jgi:aminoglycoside phosphotransferase (APT) family kinase protein|nr:phosphotransferase [Trebonia sp.]
MLRSLEVPDEASLARALERELAGRLPAGARVVPWRRGADFFALRVVVAGGAGELVLRVPLREVTTSAYDGRVDFGDVVGREAFVHGLLERAGVPVAPLLGWGRAPGNGGHSWMLFERVDHDDRASLSPAALAALGRALRRIHGIARTPEVEAAVGRQTAPEAMLERVGARVSALAGRVGYPASDELTARARAVIGQRAGLRDLRLTHMDLRPENLCFRGDDLVAVLDLSNCTLGDPAAELGRMAAYGTLTPELLGAYADGEPADDRLIAAYAVDTYALLGLLGADEFADQELVDRGVRGLDDCLRRLRGER